jgi:hypothetical protein
VDLMPIVQRDVGRMNVERLHCIDQLQYTLDLRPAGQPVSRNKMSPPGLTHGTVE